MDLVKIRSEFAAAQAQFPNTELHPNSAGGLYIRAALQATERVYIVSIYFSNNYPNEMPTVFIDTPKVTNSLHMYTKGHICYLHPSMWNPGRHNLLFVIARTAKWLSKYEIWKSTGKWPGASIDHNK